MRGAVFADTGFGIARLSPLDQLHAKARELRASSPLAHVLDAICRLEDARTGISRVSNGCSATSVVARSISTAFKCSPSV